MCRRNWLGTHILLWYVYTPENTLLSRWDTWEEAMAEVVRCLAAERS